MQSFARRETMMVDRHLPDGVLVFSDFFHRHPSHRFQHSHLSRK